MERGIKMNFEIGKFENINYIIRYPDDYCEGEKYPVIFYLHGAGSRGNNIDVIKNSVFFKLIDKHEKFPFITIAPQCSEDTWFDMFERLKKLVKEIVAADFADPDRIYAMGASMGGYATWQLAMSMPRYFAAIAPICGGGMYWNARRIVHIPIWAFHGGKDPTVLPEESQKMVDAVNKRGGNARLTVYPDNGHDAWTDTYSNPELYRWFLSHENQDPPVESDDYSDPQRFG
jgi:predicted peptidase